MVERNIPQPPSPHTVIDIRLSSSMNYEWDALGAVEVVRSNKDNKLEKAIFKSRIQSIYSLDVSVAQMDHPLWSNDVFL